MMPALLNFGRQPMPPATLRREQERAAQGQRERDALEAWSERLQGLQQVREDAAARSGAEHDRQATYYNARRRDTYEIGSTVWKKNRVLSSATQGVSAKLAPAYAVSFRAIAKLGSNTLLIADATNERTEKVHVSHIKADVDDQSSSAREDDEGETQPPRDASGESVMSESPLTHSGPPGQVTRASEKRPRGRPRKTVRVVVRPGAKITRKTQRKTSEPAPREFSPRRTRALTRAQM